MFVRGILSFILLAGVVFGAPLAQAASTPPEVLSAYKSYKTALQDKEFDAALVQAKTAWKTAENLLGDSKMTGDLAFNYGYLALQLGEFKPAAKAMERAADLAVLDPKNGAKTRLVREVELATLWTKTEKPKKVWKRVVAAREFAAVHDLDTSVSSAELRIFQALIKHNRVNNNIGGPSPIAQRSSAAYAQEALAIFENNPEDTRQDYLANAHKFIGFNHEREKKWVDAVLAYQNAMLTEKEYLTLEDDMYAATFGRWMYARSRLTRLGQYEEASEQGMCNCWPFDEQEKNGALPLYREPPLMPSRAFTSGYSVVKFDLEDDGTPKNLSTVYSWPERTYKKSALSSVRKWKYETKSDGREGAQREGIVVTISFHLRDHLGNPI